MEQFCKSLGCSFSDRFLGNNASKTLSDRIESENCHQNSLSIEFIIALNDSRLQSSKGDLYDVGMFGIPCSLGSLPLCVGPLLGVLFLRLESAVWILGSCLGQQTLTIIWANIAKLFSGGRVQYSSGQPTKKGGRKTRKEEKEAEESHSGKLTSLKKLIEGSLEVKLPTIWTN